MKSNQFSYLKNTSGKHKDWYGPDYIKIFCSELNKNKKIFDGKKFLNDYKAQYLDLELNDRLALIATLFYERSEGEYLNKLNSLRALFGSPLQTESGMFTQGFYLYPLSKFVEIYGAENCSASLDFIKDLTQRFTGEWAIRTIAIHEPKMTFSRVKEWSKDSNLHVRRLASEGLRPRLPWGKKIEWINRSPKKLIPIYTHLRNDASLYVRKSVANSMGDIIKIDPELAKETFSKWLKRKKTKDNLWVIKHAIRLPVKKEKSDFLEISHQIQQLYLKC